MASCLAGQFTKNFDYPTLLLCAEFGEDRETQDLRAEALCDGQRAGRVVQVGLGRLPVDRDWVVNDRGHAGVLQLLLEPVAAAGLG